jgi:hypothetical protein
MKNWKIIYLDENLIIKETEINSITLYDAVKKFTKNNSTVTIISIKQSLYKSTNTNENTNKSNFNDSFGVDQGNQDKQYAFIDLLSDLSSIFVITIATYLIKELVVKYSIFNLTDYNILSYSFLLICTFVLSAFCFGFFLIYLPPMFSGLISGTLLAFFNKEITIPLLGFQDRSEYVFTLLCFIALYLIVYRTSNKIRSTVLYSSYNKTIYIVPILILVLISLISTRDNGSIFSFLDKNISNHSMPITSNTESVSSQSQDEVVHISPSKTTAETNNNDFPSLPVPEFTEVNCDYKKNKTLAAKKSEITYEKKIHRLIIAELQKLQNPDLQIPTSPVSIGFVIDDSGKIVASKVCKYSGSSHADDLVLAAVNNSNPLPKPAASSPRQMKFTHTFIMHPEENDDLFSGTTNNNTNPYVYNNQSNRPPVNLPIVDPSTLINLFQNIRPFIR